MYYLFYLKIGLIDGLILLDWVVFEIYYVEYVYLIVVLFGIVGVLLIANMVFDVVVYVIG